MAIQNRLKSAGILFENGQKDDALMMVLTAVAATAEKRLPKGTQSIWRPTDKKGRPQQMKDHERFRLFLGGALQQTLFSDAGAPDLCASVYMTRFAGQMHRIESLMYSVLRCPLVHVAGLPKGVVIDEPPKNRTGIFHYDNGSGPVVLWQAPNTRLGLTEEWIHLLNHIVVTSPSNEDEFGPRAAPEETGNIHITYAPGTHPMM